MRHWLDASIAAGTRVADRPQLWLLGALAWTATVGWLVLVIGVARPPSVSELTFFGAGMFTSGAWPWNAIALAAGATALVLFGLLLASMAEAVLIRGRRATSLDVARSFAIALVVATPVLATLLVLAAAVAAVAPGEFNAPGESGPLARTVLRLAPFILAVMLAFGLAGTLHAAASRLALDGRSLTAALRDAPRLLWRARAAALVQAIVLGASRVIYLSLAALLLRVLWAPIGERLNGGGIDPALALLLVGFVAIWLCLVLGGGALHAWGSVTWTRVLGTPLSDARRGQEHMETRTGS